MIESFFGSWDLFQYTYLAGWLIGLLLSLVGVLVVARDQIFIGVAVSQASTLGIALGLGLGNVPGAERWTWLESEGVLALMAVVFAVLAALVTAWPKITRDNQLRIAGLAVQLEGRPPSRNRQAVTRHSSRRR